MIATAPTFFRPRLATREVALKESAGRRRFLFSSEVLPMFGFAHGGRFNREVVPGLGGFNLTPDTAGVQQVYSRRYTRGARKETQIEVSANDFLLAALPSWTERVHLTLRNGRLEARPVPNHTFSIRKAFKESQEPFSAFMALSAGVDAHCMESLGFRIAGHLEWRPPESRDITAGRDLTESGILTALRNSHPEIVVNEDIRFVDWNRIREQLGETTPITNFHVCLQCDDYSVQKSPAAKALSLENLTSTRDLFIDALMGILTLRPVSIMLEQVPGFGTSAECEMLTYKLRLHGYHVSTKVVHPHKEYEALTSRARFYLVASIFPGFEFPEAVGPNTTPIMDLLRDELPNCRDVSNCKAVQDGITGVTYSTGKSQPPRARHIHEGDTVAPTVTKSQSRQTKDAVYIATPDGRYLLPSRRALQRLCEIPDTFMTDHHGDELHAETIGQSVSYRAHHAIASALKAHLAANRSGAGSVMVTRSLPSLHVADKAPAPAPCAHADSQLALF